VAGRAYYKEQAQEAAASGAVRRFVYKDAQSDKFWEIRALGSSYAVHFGKSGVTGTRQEKTFESAAACRTAAEKVIAEKLKKGYTEQA
jgi:predicted DNA-binding WGR domain protein